jgi:hypothetical protein
VLEVLAKQVGVRGMFSDWPATDLLYQLHGDEVRANSPSPSLRAKRSNHFTA